MLAMFLELLIILISPQVVFGWENTIGILYLKKNNNNNPIFIVKIMTLNNDLIYTQIG